jgi:hypothetical protein
MTFQLAVTEKFFLGTPSSAPGNDAHDVVREATRSIILKQ